VILTPAGGIFAAPSTSWPMLAVPDKAPRVKKRVFDSGIHRTERKAALGGLPSYDLHLGRGMGAGPA
jgi:hypothetical protein